MPTYLSPGVYVEEVSSGNKPIEGVGTAIAAFVGMAPKGPPTSRRWSRTGASTSSGSATSRPGRSSVTPSTGSSSTVAGPATWCASARNNGDDEHVDLSPARARIGDLEVRALEPGPDGNATTIEISDPPEGSPEQTVRVVITRGDVREEHEAVPLPGRGNVVNTLNRSRLVRVELDPSVTQLEDLPRGITSLSGGELVHVDVSQARLSPDDYVGDASDRTGFAGLETVPDVTMVAVPDAMAAYQGGHRPRRRSRRSSSG